MKPTRVQPYLLLFVVATVVALVGWWGAYRLRSTLRETLGAELETTLRANADALQIWMTNQMRLAVTIATEPQLASLAMAGQVTNLHESRPEWLAGGTPAKRLEWYLRSRLAATRYDGLVIDTNLSVIAASGRGRGRVGRPVMEAHRSKLAGVLATGQPVILMPFRPAAMAAQRQGRSGGRAAGRPDSAWGGGGPPADLMLMQIAAPIRDEAGTIRGVLALVIDPDQEFTRILSVARLGTSGDTYAFDQTGQMISHSRFEAQLKSLGLLTNQAGVSTVLNLRLTDPGVDLTAGPRAERTNTPAPLIQPVAAAVAGGSGVRVFPARDYRGVPTASAWRWLAPYEIGLVTQQDAVEAYKPLRVLQSLFLTLFLLLVLAGVGLWLFSQAHVLLRRRLDAAELMARELGQYRLEEKIGEGGMGVVYRARHALMRRDTAIKLLLPDRASPEALQQFEREVCLTCQLTSANTIQIYDYGFTADGLFYYVMEYLRGLNLHELVSRFGPQPEGRVIHILAQICEALHEAHQRGLLHRDIKPSNIFLCRLGALADHVKVLDFGLVCEYQSVRGVPTQPTPTETGPVGTPMFMSPEAVRNDGPADPRSDIYSLGALGYYLVTGHYLFDGHSLDELLDHHLSTQPQAPRRRTANPISAQLEQALLQCLEKDPAARPQSVVALGVLLQRSPQATVWDANARDTWWGLFDAQSSAAPKPDTKNPGAAVLIDVVTQRLFSQKIQASA